MSYKNRGFTLIEILVVMVILGMLAALVVPNIIGRGDDAKVDTAKIEIHNIANTLDMYKLDNHSYPSTEQGLEALVTKPSGSPEPKNWQQDGYLSKPPHDPWGNPYQYISPGEHGAFDLYSLGADGQEGGEGYAADIGNWDL